MAPGVDFRMVAPGVATRTVGVEGLAVVPVNENTCVKCHTHTTIWYSNIAFKLKNFSINQNFHTKHSV